nr:polycomb group protein fertilization-independent endosperm isoform X3 [Tanacetum cinerariifolium]
MHSCCKRIVETGICILIFAGAGGHRNEVLSVDFHPSDIYRIASCGMDNTIKIGSMKGLLYQRLRARWSYNFRRHWNSILLISYMCNISRHGNPNCLETTKQTCCALNPAPRGQSGNIDPQRHDIYMIVIGFQKNGKMEGVNVVATARRFEMPLPEVCTAIEEKKKKLPSNGSQIKFEDINQIEMAIDEVGYDWSYMANKGESHALVADEKAPTEFALMANTESKVKEGVGYNAVPPPAADLYLSPKKDLSWTGLPFVDDTVTDYSRPSPTVASTSAEGQNKDSSTSENVASPNPPKPFVKFVKPKDNQPESKTKEQETPKKPQVKYAEQYRHSNKRPKRNQRNWNNLKSYQLGPEFVLHKKPCFNCGDFSHLANDCRRRVQRETTRSQNHTYRSPSHRSGGHRPHSAPMRPPLRSVGHRPHGTSMRPSNRPAGHGPHGPSMNPIRPNMNDARPNRSFFIQASSYETRPFYKSSAVKTPYRAP